MACIQQGIGPKIQGMVIGKGHDINSQFLEYGYLLRWQTKRKLLIRSSRPPAAEGKFLISHKYIAAVNDGTECPIHHTAYIPSLVIGAQHMI